MSIVRKNLRATKGKKRWAKNIDITGLLNEREEIRQREAAEAKVQEKLKQQQQLFYVDSGSNTISQKVRQALDPDRFKKKPSKRIQSKHEEKLIRRKAKALQKSEQESAKSTEHSVSKHVENNDADLDDLWGEEAPKVKSKIVKLETDIKVAAVVKPHAGQSYNPSFKEHKTLLNEVVEEEAAKHKLKLWQSKKNFRILFQKRKFRPKSAVERAIRDEVRAKKLKNKQDTDIMHIKGIIKSLKKEDEEQQKKLEEKRQEEEKERKELEEAGINRKARRLGKKKYQMRPMDFQTEEELAPNLRSVQAGTSLAREQFDGYFRRNLLDTADPFARKKKTRRLPVYKFHNVDRSRDDYDRDLGIVD